MNTPKDSFLFFYVMLCAFIWIPFHGLKAQDTKPSDSLDYYNQEALQQFSQLALRSKDGKDLTNAFAFFTQRNTRSRKFNDTLNIIHDLRYIAIIQYELGLLKESEATAVSALNFIDSFKGNHALTEESRVGINNHLGRVYADLKDYPSALNYYHTAFELQQDPQLLNSILNNIGLIYYKQADYKKALEIFTQVHQTNLISYKTGKVARSLNNIGITMSKMKMASAFDSLSKALELRTSIDYKKGIFDSYIKLVEFYQDRGDLSSANRYGEKANQLAKTLGNSSLEVEALSVLMPLNPNANVQRYTKLVDSINEANLNTQNNYAAKKYALEKQERLAKENELKLKTVELDNEQQKRLKLSYLFLSLLISVSAVFMVFYMRTKHKKEKLQSVYDTESKISKKVHDEIANDVFQLMTKIENEKQIKTDIVDELESLYYRTRDISKEHVALNEDDPFGEHLTELIESFQDVQTNIIVKGFSEIDWDTFSNIQKTTVYKVLQELLINMKKHSQASMVALVFQKTNKKLSMSYKDNGVGSTLKMGNGLQNTENRIQAIGGTITFDTELNKGFEVKISI